MNESSNFRPTAEAKGYLDTLRANGSFSRSVDAYAFSAAYAMRFGLAISDTPLKGRSDLVAVGSLDNEVRLALECGVIAIRKRNGLEPLTDSSLMLEQVTRYAEVGLAVLKDRWNGKIGLQIQSDLKQLLTEV